MRVIDAIDEAEYPGVVRRDVEHHRLAELLMNLALSDTRTVEEERLVELLERLVDDYDERRIKNTLKVLEPLALLEHLMEEGGLKQVDLMDCFGSQSVVSAVLAGKRQINRKHARRLALRFGLPLAMFLR